MAVDIAPGTIVVWADIACPWATLAIERLWKTRARLGLQNSVRFDLRAFPLELFNERPTPRITLDAEIPVVGALDPDYGWSVWKGRPESYAVSSLLALEAVQAAKDQGLAASETLDRELRRAFFVDSACITLRHVILEVAGGAEAVDVDALRAALDDGRARSKVIEQYEQAERDAISGSPHLFLPGSDVHNPGIDMHWVGPKPGGFPVIDGDDPSVFDSILRRSAAALS